VVDDEARRTALHGYGVLDADRPAALDELTALAAGIFDVPVCTVSLVDGERVWFAGVTGWNPAPAGRAASFSTRALGGEQLVVPETIGHSRFLAGAPIVDADGHVLGALCLLDERPHLLTENDLAVLAGLARQAAYHLGAVREQRELARIRQREADFVATVSHELRTPIAVMQGYLETLADDEDLAAYGPMIDPIRRNGDRLVRMVDHLLAGTDPMGPAVTLEPGRLDLGCVARAAMASCLSLAADAGIGLRMAADSESAPVRGNFGALSRAVLQLVRNAILFSGPGDEVVVRVTGAGGPGIEIVDRGAGIPAAELPHVTERFYRGRYARNNAVPGVGLGLTIAAEIIEAHGGNLMISSAGPDAGTTVRLTLPVMRAGPERRTLDRSGRRASAGPRNRPAHAARP
jgi:signal transduction histidine kinase